MKNYLSPQVYTSLDSQNSVSNKKKWETPILENWDLHSLENTVLAKGADGGAFTYNIT